MRTTGDCLEGDDEEQKREELELAAGREDVEARREQRAEKQCAEGDARVRSRQPRGAASRIGPAVVRSNPKVQASLKYKWIPAAQWTMESRR